MILKLTLPTWQSRCQIKPCPIHRSPSVDRPYLVATTPYWLMDHLQVMTGVMTRDSRWCLHPVNWIENRQRATLASNNFAQVHFACRYASVQGRADNNRAVKEYRHHQRTVQQCDIPLCVHSGIPTLNKISHLLTQLHFARTSSGIQTQ